MAYVQGSMRRRPSTLTTHSDGVVIRAQIDQRLQDAQGEARMLAQQIQQLSAQSERSSRTPIEQCDIDCLEHRLLGLRGYIGGLEWVTRQS